MPRFNFALLLTFFLVITSIPIFSVVAAPIRELPIFCVDTPEKNVAITFDAAWGAGDTDLIISILDKYNAKSTVFICGFWAEKNPDSVKKFIEAGHEIGNHSATHAHVASLNKTQNKKEIMDTHETVKELFGIEMNLYRAPYGEYNNTVLEAAEESGYYTIQWDVDSLDWKEYGTNAMIKQVLNNKSLGNGSILLFHIGSKYTPEALDEILKTMEGNGYSFVKVSELIYEDNYYLDHTGRQFSHDGAKTD